MSVLLCSTMLSGTTGLDKAVVMTANHLTRAGYGVSVVNFLGPIDGSRFILSRWPIDDGVAVAPLRTLAATGGTMLHRAFHPVLSGSHGSVVYRFTANDLAALNQLDDTLGPDDTVIFTHPLQARAYDVALQGRPRRARTLLQIHGDYEQDATGLWEAMLQARASIDAVQIIATGMRRQFVPTFATEDVHWIPNFQEPVSIPRRSHDGVEVAVIGSFQERKNQLDAVRALALVPDESVHLVLWGNHANAYGTSVRELADELGLGERVRMPGVASEREIYSGADIVVMPSLSEGYPYVLSEAACHGIPVVSYDFDFGPQDAIEDGVSGHLVPLGDVAALADRITRLAADPEQRTEFGRRSRALYESTLAPERVVERYRTVLGAPRADPLDLLALFPGGDEPVGADQISHRRIAGRHVVSVEGSTRLHDVLVDDGERCRRPTVLRRPGGTTITFPAAGSAVISYVTAPGSTDRRYLANTTSKGGLEVLPYLRRDARPLPLDPEYSDAVELSAGSSPSSRLLARHPRHPVISGGDSFGAALNSAGGVSVRNAGSPLRPTVTIGGEYDWVGLRDVTGTRQVRAPYGYGELFDRVCTAEREHGLFGLTSAEGVHVWELYRAAFLAQACEAFGLWGKHFAGTPAPAEDYAGSTWLQQATAARRVLFEFPRKPTGIDHRTAAFVDDDTLVIEYPQPDGYSERIGRDARVFPIHEFHLWRRSSRRPVAKPVDGRPFAEAMSKALGMRVGIGDQLTSRVQKFLDEREFWTPFFTRVGAEEVVIPSSHWSAGICAAARAAGARASDVQYALAGRYHPSYWFGDRPRHAAGRFYAWAPFWEPRVTGYTEVVVEPRRLPEFERARTQGRGEPEFDVCVVSQPRVFRRILAFVERLVTERPDLRVVLAPHPDERAVFAAKLGASGLIDRVTLAETSTLEAITRSAICVGGYSTSLYEAAHLGIGTYVLPVPGHELMLADVAAGLFRVVHDPAELVPFEAPPAAAELFTPAAPSENPS